MALSPGTRIGPYEILALVGVGGMGEVYRARDTKLKRDVAIKVLPESHSQNAERLGRVEREAQVLAALNHPNIAHIHGLEESSAGYALVMELVEGPTLADRIRQGPLPLAEALFIATQIADALDAAHEQGIIHRDLKPANIKVREDRTVKVLDFGLAKALGAPEASRADVMMTPTESIHATQAGVILGTAAYMSPEQARGKPVDKRTDVWAFGVVLYEMLAGRRPFQGDTTSDTLSAVLTSDPEWHRVPAKAQRLIRRCLEKDPRLRLRDIGDARLLLEDTPEAVPGWTRTTVWTLTGALVIVAAVAAWGVWRWAAEPPAGPVTRLNVDLGSDAALSAAIAISPDGTRVVFRAPGSDGRPQLATRRLDEAEETLLPGTENGSHAFFSPDGQWIGFWANGKLQKTAVQGGVPFVLCDADGLTGASWGEDGTIIAALNAFTGLSRVSADGGTPQSLTKPGGDLHAWPQFLPGGKAVLFTAGSQGTMDSGRLEVLTLETGERKTVWRGGSFGRYLPTTGSRGHLVYIHRGVLFAVPFDSARLEVQGAPAAVLHDVHTSAGGIEPFDFSQGGTFIYRSGAVEEGWRVEWLDSSGKTAPLVSRPGAYFTPRVSPDGHRLALAVDAGKGPDIAVYDSRRDVMTRLTFTAQGNLWPVWTSGGQHLIFTSAADTGSIIWWIRADGGGEPQRLFETTDYFVRQMALSPDGRHLLYTAQHPDTGSDLWVLSLDTSDAEQPKARQPEPFLRTQYNEGAPAFSPDGKWIAYVDDESGAYRQYVRRFPGPGGKWQISTDNGGYPFWSRDGTKLYYKAGPIWVVEYTADGDRLAFSTPRVWVNKPLHSLPIGYENLDLAPDGQRFAVLVDTDSASEKARRVHATILLNFFDELRRQAPVGKR